MGDALPFLRDDMIVSYGHMTVKRDLVIFNWEKIGNFPLAACVYIGFAVTYQ